MADKSFAELLADHAANVVASAKAWTDMQAAQALARKARDAEYASAEAIDAFVKAALAKHVGTINPEFKPVAVVQVDEL